MAYRDRLVTELLRAVVG
ncbi:MAG: hypothetical protein ACYCW6_03355, partial [Candidatus Xenobia bacterium]